ncbi:MAG: hypothetical protein V4574_01970 [Pseudomonadota bacterium]
MIESLTHESFEPHVGTAFNIHTDNHNEALTLAKVDPGKQYMETGRQSFSLLFDGSSNDMMIHSQIVKLKHAELGDLDIMISPVGRNDDGTFRYEAVFN